jgi:hypothetical protein
MAAERAKERQTPAPGPLAGHNECGLVAIWRPRSGLGVTPPQGGASGTGSDGAREASDLLLLGNAQRDLVTAKRSTVIAFRLPIASRSPNAWRACLPGDAYTWPSLASSCKRTTSATPAGGPFTIQLHPWSGEARAKRQSDPTRLQTGHVRTTDCRPTDLGVRIQPPHSVLRRPPTGCLRWGDNLQAPPALL